MLANNHKFRRLSVGDVCRGAPQGGGGQGGSHPPTLGYNTRGCPRVHYCLYSVTVCTDENHIIIVNSRHPNLAVRCFFLPPWLCGAPMPPVVGRSPSPLARQAVVPWGGGGGEERWGLFVYQQSGSERHRAKRESFINQRFARVT